MPSQVIFRGMYLLLAGVLACGATASAVAAEKGLKKGDRVVFLGDSITQQGAGKGGYVSLVAEALKKSHPDLNVEVIGAGISGNRVPDLEKRLEKDVLEKKPSIVVIYIGINDVWHWRGGKGTSKEDFEAGLKRIIGKINAAGGRVILCTASVIGEKHDHSNTQDTMLDEYCEIARKIAKETNSQLVDLRKAFLTHLKAHNEKNQEKSILTTDGVHLSAAGNQFVATQMLTALGVSVTEEDTHAADASHATAAHGKVLRHVVLVKFKDGLDAKEIKEVVDAFGQLPKKIDVIKGFEWGTDVSPEKLAQGFTHCFVITFADEKGRDAYLPHPAHEEFKKLALPRVDKVLVVDFLTP